MEIVPGIHQIDGVNANCFIIVRDELTLIDTGTKNSAKIVKYIQDILKRDPSEIKTIILTHCHFDHAGNLCDLDKISGARVAIHEADADYVAGRKTQPVPGGGMGMIFKVLRVFINFEVKPVEPDIKLNDGDTVAGLTCIHTPGHTPGSICLFDPATKILFAGDILRFNGVNIKMGPGSLDPGEIQQSIKKIAKIDFDILLPGHGIPLRPNASLKVREFAKSLP